MSEVSKKELNLKNKFRNIIKKIFKFTKYITVLIFFMSIIFVGFRIKNKYLLKQNIEESLEENVVDQDENIESIKNNLYNLEENIKLKEELFSSKIKNFENLVLRLQEKIEILQNNILNLENINPTNNEKNLQIVILLYKIQDTVYKGGDFSKYLEYLINLAKNKEFIFENILKLKKYTNQKTQKDLKNIFSKEYLKVISLNKNNNKIKFFLDDNIKIRKISNFDENTDRISINISNIEKNIEIFNYQEAINIIINNNYIQYFNDTLNILNEKNEVFLIINKILDFIYDI